MPAYAPSDREIAIIYHNTNIDGGGEAAWYNGDDNGFLKNFFAGTIYAGYREGGTGPFAFVPNNSTASTALSTTAMETQLARNWYRNQFGGQLILQLHLARKAAPFATGATADSQVWSGSKVANARGIVRKLADRFPNATGARGVKIWLGTNEGDLTTEEVVYPGSNKDTAIARFVALDKARWEELRGPNATFKHPGILGSTTTSAQALLGGTGTFRVAEYLTYNNGEVLNYIDAHCTTNHHKNMGPEDGAAGMWGAEPATGVQTFYRVWKAIEAARTAYGAGAPRIPVLATEWGNGLKAGNYIGTLSGEWATDDNTQNGKHILRTYRLGLAVNALFYYGVTLASFYSLAFSPAEHGTGASEIEKTRGTNGTQNLYYVSATSTLTGHQPEANVAARIWDMRRYIVPIDGRLTIPTKTWQHNPSNLDNGFHVPYTWAVCAPAYNQPDGTSLATAPWASWREVTFPGGGEIVSAAGVKKIVCRPVFLPRHTDWTVEAEVKCTGSGVAQLCVRGYDLLDGLAFVRSSNAGNAYATLRVTFRPKGHTLNLPNAARAVVCLFHNGTGEARMRNVSIFPSGSGSPSAEPLAVTASATPVTGNVPLAVTFSATATGGTGPYTYAWNFGDTVTSTAQNPSHTYTTAGAYTARCTVTDSTGATASATVGITATNAASTLIAAATASPASGDAPLSVTFGGSATGGTSPYTYAWAFGDGGTSAAQNPTHNYTAAGTYTATLTVTDAASATDADTKTITVTTASGDSCLSSTSNLFLNPCSAATATKRPIGSNATYAGTSHNYTVAWLRGGAAAGMLAVNLPRNGWASGHWDCTNTANTVSVTVTANAKASAETRARLPLTIRIPRGFNASFNGPTDRDNHALFWNGTNFYDFAYFWTVTENSAYTCGAFPGVHAGGGQGHGGSPRSTSASGIWHEGMTIRGHEWNNAATGKCEHMLGIALGSRAGDAVGPQLSPNRVWPASSVDNSATSNTGPIPYGTIFAIPPPSKGGPDPSTLSLGAADSIKARLYWQMRNYGWVACDKSNNPSLRADQVITDANAAALQTAARALYPHMRAITNVGTSGSNPIGGGTPIAPNCAFNRSATPSIQPVSWWAAKWGDGSQDLGNYQAMSLSTSDPKDGWSLYRLAVGIDGNSMLYRATKDTKFLERALMYIENCINRAVVSNNTNFPSSSYKDGYRGWINITHPQLPDNDEQQLHEFYMWRYVMQLLYYARNETAYASRLAAILAFTEQHIWTKWYGRGSGQNRLYRETIYMASHTAIVALYLRTMATSATVRSQCQTVLDNIDHDGMAIYTKDSIRASFRRQMQVHPNDPDAYIFKAFWPSFNRSEPNYCDRGHADAFLTYVIAAVDQSYGDWSASDINKFIAMAAQYWPNSTTFYTWLIGSSGGGNDGGNYNDGTLKLGGFNAAFQRRVETHTSTVNGAQFQGCGALNAARLLGTI